MRNILQTWELELLTPLHIGDGQVLKENQDFTVQSNAVNVFGLDQILEEVKDNPAMISDICAHGLKIQDLKRHYRLTLHPLYTIPLTGGASPREIRRFIKDAFLRPYLPGSTLKGAIHTSLWVALDRSRLPKVDRPDKKAWSNFREKVERLQGQDPHHSFIRPLKVTDSEALAPKEALCVQEVKYFNLMGNQRGGWKSFEGRGNPTVSDYQNARGVFVEALKAGTRLICQVGLDGFLLEGKVKGLAGYPECKGVQSFGSLFDLINQHSLKMAQKERDFFVKYQAPPQVIRFYEALMEQINGFNGKEVAYLRMAWGSGWRGMTGDWMTHGQFEAAKTFERFGRIVGAVFPKTRRLAVKDGIPCLPMGWVKIRPTQQRSLSVPKVSPETKGITKRPEEIKSKFQQEFPRAERPLSSLKSEIWEGATITYNPGKREFVVNYQGKKATFKDETLLPSSITNRLVEKRQPTKARVEVELEGNYHKVVRVEA